MKILIPVLTFGKGGGERVLAKLANELIHLGHSVEFLCPEGSKLPYYPTIATIWWADISGNITDQYKNDSAKTENGFSIQRKLKKALSRLSKNAYDIIIANQSLTVLPIKLSGWAYKTLYYVQAYEPEFYINMGGHKNKILSELSALTYTLKLFTVVNANVYLNYKNLKATRTLYPGVDTPIFYPKETAKLKTKNDKIIIGTVGRLERFKGTQFILDAFLLLRARYSNVELHVAFGDPANFELYEGVHCFRPDGDEALANFYRTLDYYICAGFIQLGAFHYPVVEAMCCGIPVITTPYYPANESNAWITGICDATSIVKQFELAQADDKRRAKKVGQALEDIKQFDWKKVGERMNSYLNELMNKVAKRNNKTISK
ncbi:MAG: glycosyltransferase family 4 protein [Ferruginibacter sp.]